VEDYRCAHEYLEELSHPTSTSRDLVISCVTTCRQRDANARPSQIRSDAAFSRGCMRKAGGVGLAAPHESIACLSPTLTMAACASFSWMRRNSRARLRRTTPALSARPAAKEVEWITNESKWDRGSSAQAEARSGRLKAHGSGPSQSVRVSRCRACTCDEAAGSSSGSHSSDTSPPRTDTRCSCKLRQETRLENLGVPPPSYLPRVYLAGASGTGSRHGNRT
jgi:hypothetical protein